MRLSFARLTQIVGAWSFWTIFGIVYDDICYPLAILKWGPLCGGGGMALLAILICVVTVIWYEKTKTDWLGVNVVEEVKAKGVARVTRLDAWLHQDASKDGLVKGVCFLFRLIGWGILFVPSRLFLLTLWALNKNDTCAFVALSITQDPFITTIFLRHGRFDGLRKKDWLVFTASALLCNGYWIARSTVLVEIIKIIWKQMFENN